MANVSPMSTMTAGLAELSTTELEALEREHPELGRIEILDGALHAAGDSAVGYLHQMVVQRLYLAFVAALPADDVLILDCWWLLERGKLRPDVALYHREDVPADLKSFRTPPWATLEVLSDDADHDLVHKDGVYAEQGVTRRAYVEPWGRFGWWCRLDGVEHAGPTAMWELPAWPPLRLERDVLLDVDTGRT